VFWGAFAGSIIWVGKFRLMEYWAAMGKLHNAEYE
jgi:hypothetical protein